VHAADEQNGADHVIPGLYVCGWMKRGPTGIIGTNLTDAEETVASMEQDVDHMVLNTNKAGAAGLHELLCRRGVNVVDWAGFERLNQYELQQGQLAGASRVKVVSLDGMLQAAGC